MIASQDRSGYFGCSDTTMVVGNWKTKTFEKWWLEKLGLYKNEIKTDSMLAGTFYEHKILEALKIKNLKKDAQFIIEDLKLRANLDGNTDECIYEVKTYNSQKEFKVSKQYWRQAQVEMFASKIYKLNIVAYALVPEDYDNYFNDIDNNRISMYEVTYDNNFIHEEYLPKLKRLVDCLKRGEFPVW